MTYTVAQLMVWLSDCKPQSKITITVDGKTYDDFIPNDLWDLKKVNLTVKEEPR